MATKSERQGPVLIITLDREEKRNAIDPDTTAGIESALNLLEDDDELQIAIITGGPNVFSAGSDLKQGSGRPTERGGEYGIIRRRMLKPLIAAVEGFAFGGGMEIVLACDLVVASRSAQFGLPEIKHGLLAAFGGVFRTPRNLPLNVAKHMVLTGDPISADQAAHYGLVNVLCEPGCALEEALSLADRVISNSPVSIRESLRILDESFAEAERAGWAATDPAYKRIRDSEDSVEGRNAFFERRKPRWQKSTQSGD